MRKTFFALGSVLLLLSLSAAQDSVAAPKTRLPFCPPKTCLYYSGDFDSNNQLANGLLNVNSFFAGVAEVWVAVKPTQNVTVTGVTFNELFSSIDGDINPTPFQINVGMSAGNGGKKFCTSQGIATIKGYGEGGFGLIQFSVTVKKLMPSCKLKKGRIYFLNLLPTFNNSNSAFLMDVEYPPAPNHRGWPNVVDDSYFYAASGDINYSPTWGSSGGCGGIGCDLFSFALTGTKQ